MGEAGQPYPKLKLGRNGLCLPRWGSWECPSCHSILGAKRQGSPQVGGQQVLSELSCARSVPRWKALFEALYRSHPEECAPRAVFL